MIRVNICMAYFIQVAQFFADVLPETRDAVKVKVVNRPQIEPPESSRRFSFQGHFRKPQIVLFADPLQKHSHILVMEVSPMLLVAIYVHN